MTLTDGAGPCRKRKVERRGGRGSQVFQPKGQRVQEGQITRMV